MRLNIRGEYPDYWPLLAQATKAAAEWRCVRCRHPFNETTGKPLPCDGRCDRVRCHAAQIAERGGSLSFTVHHLNGDKSQCAWWNLLATCNSCHLTVQARVIPERPWLFEHSPWFKPFVAGFYAWYFAGEQVTQEHAMAHLDRYLALGQPWLTESATT